ncbi:MAG TPA: amino acid ABC transporter substrate-binding protein [Candidatus Binatia bacterium]|nr:amino acid ABC transporter substrate-binding protein [Candidatus Binatia bacterium]
MYRYKWLQSLKRFNSTILQTLALLLCWAFIAPAWAADPIKVGFSMSLTGAGGPAGKQVIVALEIWRDDVNVKGGLLGRPIELVFYDDQTMPANVPAIYTKLIDVDKVDLLIGPYATNMIAAAIPVIAQRKLTTIGMLGLAANSQFHYKGYFSMLTYGANPAREFSRGFFELAKAQNPRPQTVAIVGADAEFGKTSTDGARANALAAGFKIVYDNRYPPSMTDLAPIARAIKATNPDIVFAAAYPPDTVAFVRAANEVGLTPKMMGGTLIGMLAMPLKAMMGPLMNGYINNAEVFMPVPTLNFPGTKDVLDKYRERAKGQGIDPFGFNFAPYGFATGQVLAAAVTATKSLDHAKLADYMHSNSFSTTVGEISFGPDGEWVKPRSIVSQWQNLTGNDIGQLIDPKKWVVVWPPEHKTGDFIYPYSATKK